MDLRQTNPETLRRLLNKRQSSCNQIFKQQPTNSTSVPMSAMDLPRNGFSTTHDHNLPHFTVEDSTFDTNPSNMFNQSQSQSQTLQEESTTHNTSESPSSMEEDDEDGPSYDKVQKKIKTTMISNQGLKYQRSFGCDDEKEQSEHSTTCDLHSEPCNNETGDYLLSPSMGSHSPKDASELRLDDNVDSPIRSGLIQINLTPEEINAAIGPQASDNVSSSCAKPKIKVKCQMNHSHEVDPDVTTKQPCPRCQELLEECRSFAQKNEGTCLNQEYEETIKYRCTKGHVWSLNFKNARRRWCAQCSKEQRNLLKQKCEEEKLEREKQEEECQKKLFEEARKRAGATGNGNQPSRPSGANNASQKSVNTLEYFQRMDYEIETLAKKYTISFMSQKEFAGDLHYQQILQVYKIVIMPEEILQAYMFNLNADALRSEFRRMAKIIHPDKNKHPQAGIAFQKIYKVYEIALSRFEGTQQKI